MTAMHDVALHTGTTGLRLDVWDQYSVTLSMLEAGIPFAFQLYKSNERRAAWSTLRQHVRIGDRLFFSIDGAVQLNGYVGSLRGASSRKAGTSLVVSGRDMLGPALTWDADPTLRLKGLPLAEALTRLYSSVGVSVRIGDRALAIASQAVQSGTAHVERIRRATIRPSRRTPIDYARPRPGERVDQVVQAILRRMGLMRWTAPDPDGGLSVVVDTPDYGGTAQYQLRLVHGDDGKATADSNVEESDYSVSVESVPTAVHVYTANARSDQVSARAAMVLVNTHLDDPAITGGWTVSDLLEQPRHIKAQRARTLAGCQRHAERVLADAMAGFRTYECTVKGHGQTLYGETPLYAINTMAHVRDDEWGLDEDMLVLRVQFQRSRANGTTTRLTLGPKGAIVLTPDTDA